MAIGVLIALGIASTLLLGPIGVRLGPEVWSPHVPVIFVVLAAYQRSTFHGLLVAMTVGGLAALLSGGSRGVYLLALLPVLLIAASLRARGLSMGSLALAGVCVLGSLLADAITWPFLLAFSGDAPWTGILLRNAPPSALLTGLLAWPLIWLWERVEPMLRAQQARQRFLLPEG